MVKRILETSIFGFPALACLMLGVIVARMAVEDATIAKTWIAAEATIVAADPPRRSRYGSSLPVQLRVDNHRGTFVVRWAERDLELPWPNWSQTRPTPVLGDRIAVFVAQQPPYRIMPTSELSGFWTIGFLLVLSVVGGFAFTSLAVLSWRAGSRNGKSRSENSL